MSFGKLGVAILAVLFAACSSDSDGGGGSTPSGTYIKSKIDGVEFKTLEVQGQSLAVAMKTGSGDQTLIMISGGGDMNGSTSMAINLLGISTPGTYNITPDSDSVMAYIDNTNTTSYDTSNCDGATGTITITTLNDTKIDGTFNFTAKNDENCTQSKAVTQGSFRGVFLQN